MTLSLEDRARIRVYWIGLHATRWMRNPTHAYLTGLAIGTALTIAIFEATT